MQVELFKPSEMNADFWQAFTMLRDASADYDDPFFDPEFARLVGEIRDDTFIAVGFDAGQTAPSAFWPLHVRPGGWARPIGGPFSDWHGPVLKKGEVIDPCLFLSAAGLSGFTAFGMPGALSWGHIPNRAGAHLTLMQEGWDAYLASQAKLYPKHFKKMRRLQRNIQRDFTDIRYNLDDTSRDAFDWLIERKRCQYDKTGRHDVLAPDWVRDLLERLRGHHSSRLSARLMTLRLDGQIVAAEFDLCSDRIIHGWLVAFDPDYGSYAPGYLLRHEILRAMDGMEQSTYDASAGQDYYKKYYTNYQLPMDAGVLRAEPKTGLPRLMAEGWRLTENALPGPFGGLMGKVRRRTDQIVMSETSLGGRLSGFARALKP